MVNLAMQTKLPLTPNNSFAQILENEFANLKLNIFVNARLKKTWRIEKQKNMYSLIIPPIFIDANDEIKKAILKWVQIIIQNKFSRKKNLSPEKRKIKQLEEIIYEFLKQELGLHSSRRSFTNPKEKFKNTKGAKFDLQEIFDSINKIYFNDDINCFLRWGRAKSRTSYHTVCTDESGKPFDLITIAGCYNLKSTPEFAIESVMYHEMLHIAIPPITLGHKRSVHHRQFREMERQFPHFQKWKEWQKSPVIYSVKKGLLF